MLLIDYYKIKENIRNIKKKHDLVIVLKNDAYNFGLYRIIDISQDESISEFAVNDIKEAIKIRKLNERCKVLLLGTPNLGFDYKLYNIFPTAQSLCEIKFFENNSIEYYAKVNSNMNRFGIDNVNEIIGKVRYMKGLYLHLPKYSNEGIITINKYKNLALAYNLDFHAGGSILINKIDCKLRVGGSIYKDCRKLYAHILAIKEIKKGEPIGYESKYIAPEDHLYAILDVGYFNGISKNFNGSVCINSTRYNSIGLVCMNHTFIRVDTKISTDNLVEFFGDNIKIEEFLEYNHMSLYESFFYIK